MVSWRRDTIVGYFAALQTYVCRFESALRESAKMSGNRVQAPPCLVYVYSSAFRVGYILRICTIRSTYLGKFHWRDGLYVLRPAYVLTVEPAATLLLRSDITNYGITTSWYHSWLFRLSTTCFLISLYSLIPLLVITLLYRFYCFGCVRCYDGNIVIIYFRLHY